MPLGGGAIGDRTCRHGMLLEQSRSQRCAIASARRVTRATSRGAARFGSRCALRARMRYPRTAESRLVLPPLSFARKRSRQRAADQTNFRHPRAFSDALRVAVRMAGGGVGTGFEPATPRLRSGALSTELTGGGDQGFAFVKLHVRNTQHQPLILCAACRWPSDAKTLLVIS